MSFDNVVRSQIYKWCWRKINRAIDSIMIGLLTQMMKRGRFAEPMMTARV